MIRFAQRLLPTTSAVGRDAGRAVGATARRLLQVAWVGVLLLGVAPRSGATEFLSVDQVESGMTGVGRTVFRGTEIEEFGVEIIGVIERARPAGSLILFRGQGEILEHAGIIQGMSGSPVYIDGKLIGAVAFAYPGALDPIGAITPIGEMLSLWEGELGPAEGQFPSTGDIGAAVDPGGETTMGEVFDFDAIWGAFTEAERAVGAFHGPDGAAPDPARGIRGSGGNGLANWIAASPFADPSPSAGLGPGGLAPIQTPICLSGWDPSLEAEMRAVFARLGLPAEPVAAGMSLPASRHGRVDRLEPGSAIGLRMIGGDVDLVAIGTVTHVDGDRVVAFGHPMIQSGPVSFPMTGAWIHTVLPNRSVSSKMASSLNELGGVWNDRRAGIAGTHGPVPAALPVSVEVTDDRGDTDRFRYTVARHPLLTPFFLPWTVVNSYLAAGWVSGDASIRTEVRVFYDGGKVVERVERIAADAPGGALGADVTLPAVLLAVNPWEGVHLDSMSVKVAYERGNPGASLTGLRSSHARARPGDVVKVTAELRPFRGEPESREFSVAIPTSWAGRSLRLFVGANSEFASWDQDRVPEKFVPHSLEQMVQMIERMPDDSNLTLRIYAEEPGALLQGVELPGLPPSLAQAAAGNPRPGGLLTTSASLLDERHLATPWVLSGGAVLPLQIATQ